MQTKIKIDGRTYSVKLLKKVAKPSDAVRLVIVSFQPNKNASELCKASINAIKKFTQDEEYELWVIDNNSPKENIKWLYEVEGINLVFNRTTPIPKEGRGFIKHITNVNKPFLWGSYANGIALEIAAKLVDPDTGYFMPLHMDTMPCRDNWLKFLKSKIKGNIAASGVRYDNVRVKEGILHVLGYIIDFQLFKKYNLNFLPQLPDYDVGDLAIVNLKKQNHEIFACPNTLWQPELVENINNDDMKKIHVDRSFDDNGNIIFLHLGRGLFKSVDGQLYKTTLKEWIEFSRRI